MVIADSIAAIVADSVVVVLCTVVVVATIAIIVFTVAEVAETVVVLTGAVASSVFDLRMMILEQVARSYIHTSVRYPRYLCGKVLIRARPRPTFNPNLA